MGIVTTLMLAASTEEYWSNELFGLDANQRFVVVLTVMGCITGAIITIAAFIYSAVDAAHRRRTEADLKREMLDRGMTVDEMVKVVEAAAPPEDVAGRWLTTLGKCRK